MFNKGGRSFRLSYQFDINGQNLDVVDEYCYLGIVFQPSGLFTKAVNYLYSKSIKAKAQAPVPLWFSKISLYIYPENVHNYKTC